MSVENQNNSDPQDYARALEVLREVSEHTVEKLGQEAVEAAEAITHQTGELEPKRTVADAETITRVYGSMLPRQVVDTAKRITAYDAEVSRTGEELSDGERADLDDSVARQAADMLFRENDKRMMLGALGFDTNDMSSQQVAYKYALRKAKTWDERNKIIEAQEKMKNDEPGDNQPPKSE